MSRRAGLVMGGLLVAVLLVAVGVLLGRSGSTSGSQAAPAPATSSRAGSGSSPPASWVDDYSFYEIPGGQRVPRSASAGPFHLTERGTLATGFAHSPQGAVMATMNIVARTNWDLGEPMWEPTINNQVIGTWKTQMMKNARRYGRPDLPPPGQLVPTAVGHVAGFQLVSYSPEVAQVRWLASNVGDGGSQEYAAASGEVHWIDGDWRLVAPPNGSWGGTGETVPGTAGFILLPGY
ncbi:hypothetical protein MXD61_08905 [Frankia sp. AgPm24]|uniref:hypothetical protein n=1 Tax=Frankia sp. AgPm24 TaxID=631128 RepID=UPI00200E5F63|nr:hypothetical protein [Frankia sp. AgPm24]MCK9922000.1 hypothetical protein [Frankia sp. AgPm24]